MLNSTSAVPLAWRCSKPESSNCPAWHVSVPSKTTEDSTSSWSTNRPSSLGNRRLVWAKNLRRLFNCGAKVGRCSVSRECPNPRRRIAFAPRYRHAIESALDTATQLILFYLELIIQWHKHDVMFEELILTDRLNVSLITESLCSGASSQPKGARLGVKSESSLLPRLPNRGSQRTKSRSMLPSGSYFCGGSGQRGSLHDLRDALGGQFPARS